MSNTWFAKTYSSFVDCLFIFCFCCCAEVLSLIYSHFFFFLFVPLVSHPESLCQDQCWGSFALFSYRSFTVGGPVFNSLLIWFNFFPILTNFTIALLMEEVVLCQDKDQKWEAGVLLCSMASSPDLKSCISKPTLQPLPGWELRKGRKRVQLSSTRG